MDCSELVASANKEMNKWAVSDPNPNVQMIVLEEILKSNENDAPPGHNEIFLHDDSVEADLGED